MGVDHHVERGESSRSAVTRELTEEVIIPGGFPSDPIYAGLFEHEWTENSKLLHELNHLWHIPLQIVSKWPMVESREKHLSFSWINMDALKDIDFRPFPLADSIQMWLSGNRTAPLFGSTLRDVR
jgi:hypothetical protein